MRLPLFLAAITVMMATHGAATATIILVGDHDGYGAGFPDNSSSVVWPGPGSSGSNYDGRSAAEMAATNGAQFTDNYSALHPGFGPNTVSVGNIIFPLASSISSATLTIGMGDFQASTFGQLLVSFNGVVQPNLFNFEDGFQHTVLRSFTLSASAIANANAAGQFVITINRNNSADFVAFDFFQLDAAAVPEPTSLVLFGLVGLVGVGAAGYFRRGRARVA